MFAKRTSAMLLSLIISCPLVAADETDCVHWRAAAHEQPTALKVMDGILNVFRWVDPAYAVVAGTRAVATRDSYQSTGSKPMCENPDPDPAPLSEEEMAITEEVE